MSVVNYSRLQSSSRSQSSRFALIVLLVLLCSRSAHAHGGGTPRLVNAGDGPYRIFVWTEPEPLRAGEIHISIAITEPAADEGSIDDRNLSNNLESAVKNASIALSLTLVDDPDVSILVEALPSTVSDFFYEVDLTLPVEGDWKVVLTTAAELGVSEAQFVAEVLPARQINWLIVGGGIGSFILLFVGLGMIARRPKEV